MNGSPPRRQGRRPAMPPPIESDAFRQKLRPTRPTVESEPFTQLTLPFVFSGEGKRRDAKEHLSGAVLAALSGG